MIQCCVLVLRTRVRACTFSFLVGLLVQHSVQGSETGVCYLARTRWATRQGDRTLLEGTGWVRTGHGWVRAGRTGLLGLACVAGPSNHVYERVAATDACEKVPFVQRLSRGSGARASVRQCAAVDTALPSVGSRQGEVVPDARDRQGCAQAPAATERAEGVVLLIISWIFPRTVTAVTLAHEFILWQPRAARACHGHGLQRTQSRHQAVRAQPQPHLWFNFTTLWGAETAPEG